MSGTLLSLLPMTRFNFLNVSSAGTVDAPLVQNIDVSGYSKGTLLVRTHEQDIASGGELKVRLVRVLPTMEDPTKFFQGGTSAEVSLGAGTSGAALDLDDLEQPLGGYVTLRVIGTHTTASTTLDVTISVELLLQD